MLKRRRSLITLLTQAVDLPAGYRQIPYLSTDKTKSEFISTMVYGEPDIRVELDVVPIDYAEAGVFIFFSAEEGSKRYAMIVRNNNLFANIGSQLKPIGFGNVEIGKRYKFMKNGLRNFVNGVEYTSNEGAQTTITERSLIRLSATNIEPNDTNIYATSLHIYGCKIWRSTVEGEISESDELLRNYIPVTNGTQEALYDTVNKELYFKDGSCEFYHNIDYVFNNIRKKEYWDIGFFFIAPGNYSTNMIKLKFKLVDYPSYGLWNILGANSYPEDKCLRVTSYSNVARFICGKSSNFLQYTKVDSDLVEYLNFDKASIYDLSITSGVSDIRNGNMLYNAYFQSVSDVNITKPILLGAHNGNNGPEGLTGIRIYNKGQLGTYIILHPMSNGIEEVLEHRNQITNETKYIHKSILT